MKNFGDLTKEKEILIEKEDLIEEEKEVIGKVECEIMNFKFAQLKVDDNDQKDETST